jgi:hypothetical protein
MIASLAMWLETRGSSTARESAVLNAAISEGFTSKEYARGDVLSQDDAMAFYADVLEVGHRPAEEIVAKIREDLECFRKTLEQIPTQISNSEFHAASGDDAAFDRALQV